MWDTCQALLFCTVKQGFPSDAGGKNAERRRRMPVLAPAASMGTVIGPRGAQPCHAAGRSLWPAFGGFCTGYSRNPRRQNSSGEHWAKLHAQSATKTEDFLWSEQKPHAPFCATDQLTYVCCGACRVIPRPPKGAYFWFSVVAGSIGRPVRATSGSGHLCRFP